jgi:hypothetical protein
MLRPVGDPERPDAIDTRPPGGRWCHGPIQWDSDEGRALFFLRSVGSFRILTLRRAELGQSVGQIPLPNPDLRGPRRVVGYRVSIPFDHQRPLLPAPQKQIAPRRSPVRVRLAPLPRKRLAYRT